MGVPWVQAPSLRGARVIRLRSVPLFKVLPVENLPPIDGEAAVTGDGQLRFLMEELVEAANFNILPPPGVAPDSPSVADAFAALRNATSAYHVAADVPLSHHFWTFGSALRNGDVARRLLESARKGCAVQGFVALHADEIRSGVLYSPRTMPIRVGQEISLPANIGGPYLVLLACELTPDGRAEVAAVDAVPIYKVGRLLPVRSELDRDVLKALEHLQCALDVHGAECTITRIRPFAHTDVTHLSLTIRSRAFRRRDAVLAINPYGAANASSEDADFCVTHRNWTSGGLIAWLERTILD